jgi:hypothetical protein
VKVIEVDLDAHGVFLLVGFFGRVVFVVLFLFAVGAGALEVLAAQPHMADVQRVGLALGEEHQRAPVR